MLKALCVYVVFLPEKRIINEVYYIKYFGKVGESYWSKEVCSVLPLQNNAQHYTVADSHAKLEELYWTALHHPVLVQIFHHIIFSFLDP